MYYLIPTTPIISYDVVYTLCIHRGNRLPYPILSLFPSHSHHLINYTIVSIYATLYKYIYTYTYVPYLNL